MKLRSYFILFFLIPYNLNTSTILNLICVLSDCVTVNTNIYSKQPTRIPAT